MDDNYKEAGFDETISERERRRQQLELEFSFDGYYAIRKELYADLKDPAMTIRDGSICFNNACISALDNVMQIETFFNDDLKRFALFKSRPGATGSLRKKKKKKGKRSSRKISCPDLTNMIYSVMQWDKKLRYKILGYLIEVDEHQVFVFDFKYYKMFRVHPKKGEPGHEDPIDRKGTFSEELLDNFGTPMDEYLRETEVVETDGYVSMAALTGPSRSEAGMSETNASETNAPEQLAFEDLPEARVEPQKQDAGSMPDAGWSAAEAGGLNV